MFVEAYSAASNVSVPARDFSAWLQRTVAPHDTVHLVMDAAGAYHDHTSPHWQAGREAGGRARARAHTHTQDVSEDEIRMSGWAGGQFECTGPQNLTVARVSFVVHNALSRGGVRDAPP